MENQHKPEEASGILEDKRQRCTGLCCCYAIDADGNYVDPCFKPGKESGQPSSFMST